MGYLLIGDVENEEDDYHGDAADREVDVETPAPGEAGCRGEGSADQRAGHRCYAHERSKEAVQNRAAMEGNNVDYTHNL